MTQKRMLVFVPFEDILEEVEPLDSLLWFLAHGFKEFIVFLINNLSAEESIQFNEIDLSDHCLNLYGQTPLEHLTDLYFEGCEILDRCDASARTFNEDKLIIETICAQVMDLVQTRLSNVFMDELVSEIDPDFIPFWSAKRLVIALKSKH